MSVDPNGQYLRDMFLALPAAVKAPGVFTDATAALTLPDQVTASFRQIVTEQLTLLGTVEWTNWSRIGNVSATSQACPGGLCETLNLNYRDGWFFSLGGEYAYNSQWTFRAGAGYEISPITDSNRDILLPDANRVHVSVGATYKWSDKIAINAAYSHIFFDNESFLHRQSHSQRRHIALPFRDGGRRGFADGIRRYVSRHHLCWRQL